MVRRIHASDYADLDQWHKGHKDRPLPSCAPFGYIEDGLAAGFLIFTDAGFGVVDGFITNPKAPLRARGQALNRVADAIVKAADEYGLTRLLAMPSCHGIAALAGRHGFKSAGPHVILAREGNA